MQANPAVPTGIAGAANWRACSLAICRIAPQETAFARPIGLGHTYPCPFVCGQDRDPQSRDLPTLSSLGDLMAQAASAASAANELPAVQMIGVNKWFGEFHVLRNIDLTVHQGEKIVVCGPSGSGKSTLIRCINRLEEHQKGQIIVEGIELTNDVRQIDKIRSEVGMVFQSFNLFPHLTVLDNLCLAPVWVKKLPRREAEQIATKYLQRVKIPEQANKYPGQLSGGQQKRVAIARALCMNPHIMLFDEPTY